MFPSFNISVCGCECESCSVVSNSLRPHRLYSPWNSPDQNTGVGSLSLLQGIFPTQGSNPGLPHCRWILYQLSHKGSPNRTIAVKGFMIWIRVLKLFIFLEKQNITTPLYSFCSATWICERRKIPEFLLIFLYSRSCFLWGGVVNLIDTF